MNARRLLTALLLAASPLYADFVMVQKVENKASGMDMNMEITMKHRGDKMRVDAGAQSSSIIDLKTGDMTTLMPAQKAYFKMQGSQLKSMAQQMMPGAAKPGATPATPPVPKATGKKERINGYDTEEYTVDMAGNQASLWVAKDFPNAKKLMEAMAKMNDGPLGQMGGGMSPDLQSLPGFPIRTVVNLGDMGSVTSTVLSVREETLSDSEFEVPADFKPITMPGLGEMNLPTPPQPGQ